jgi:hypothetical protein
MNVTTYIFGVVMFLNKEISTFLKTKSFMNKSLTNSVLLLGFFSASIANAEPLTKMFYDIYEPHMTEVDDRGGYDSPVTYKDHYPEYQTRLMRKCHRHYVKEKVKKGASLSQFHPKTGYSPLMYAARMNDLRAVRFLLALGADPLFSVSKRTALDVIGEVGYDNVLKAIAEVVNNQDTQLLDHHLAESSPSSLTSSSLVSALERQAGKGLNLDPSVVAKAIKEITYKTKRKATHEELKALEDALKAGANSNHVLWWDMGWTPLFYATYANDISLIRLLLKHGANPLAVSAPTMIEVHGKSRIIKRPFDLANGNPDLLRELLKGIPTKREQNDPTTIAALEQPPAFSPDLNNSTSGNSSEVGSVQTAPLTIIEDSEQLEKEDPSSALHTSEPIEAAPFDSAPIAPPPPAPLPPPTRIGGRPAALSFEDKVRKLKDEFYELMDSVNENPVRKVKAPCLFNPDGSIKADAPSASMLVWNNWVTGKSDKSYNRKPIRVQLTAFQAQLLDYKRLLEFLFKEGRFDQSGEKANARRELILRKARALSQLSSDLHGDWNLKPEESIAKQMENANGFLSSFSKKLTSFRAWVDQAKGRIERKQSAVKILNTLAAKNNTASSLAPRQIDMKALQRSALARKYSIQIHGKTDNEIDQEIRIAKKFEAEQEKIEEHRRAQETIEAAKRDREALEKFMNQDADSELL